MQPIGQLQHAIARIHALLDEGDSECLPDLVRQYAADVHTLSNDAPARPVREPLRHLLARHQQVIAQMHRQQQALAQAIASRRHGSRAARAYLSASA